MVRAGAAAAAGPAGRSALVACCIVWVELPDAALVNRQLPFVSTVDSPSETRNVNLPVWRRGRDAVLTTTRSGWSSWAVDTSRALQPPPTSALSTSLSPPPV